MNLLDLPAEIRVMIQRYAYVADKPLDASWDRKFRHVCAKQEPLQNSLSISREWFAEAKVIFWSDNVFTITVPNCEREADLEFLVLSRMLPKETRNFCMYVEHPFVAPAMRCACRFLNGLAKVESLTIKASYDAFDPVRDACAPSAKLLAPFSVLRNVKSVTIFDFEGEYLSRLKEEMQGSSTRDQFKAFNMLSRCSADITQCGPLLRDAAGALERGDIPKFSEARSKIMYEVKMFLWTVETFQKNLFDHDEALAVAGTPYVSKPSTAESDHDDITAEREYCFRYVV